MSTRLASECSEAYDLLEGSADSAAFITCEHASDQLFAPWALVGSDARLIGTHWTFDPGAEAISRELAAELDAPAVLARFSRLIVDPNRELSAPTLLRDVADAEAILLNTRVTDADRDLRIERFYAPYHAAIDRGVRACSAPIVFPVHTFTDEYEGTRRLMELGVLFDRDRDLAEAMNDRLAAAGFQTALNEPWSGKDGLIYSGERHALAHGRRVIELEVRQDRALDPEFRRRLVPVVADVLREFAARFRASGSRA